MINFKVIFKDETRMIVASSWENLFYFLIKHYPLDKLVKIEFIEEID